MEYRKQCWFYFAHQLKYLSKDQLLALQKNPDSSEENLLTDITITHRQFDYIHFLYIKNCILKVACQRDVVTEQQAKKLLANQIATLIAKPEHIKFTSLQQGILSRDFFDASARKLCAQKLFTRQDVQFLQSLISEHEQSITNCKTADQPSPSQVMQQEMGKLAETMPGNVISLSKLWGKSRISIQK